MGFNNNKLLPTKYCTVYTINTNEQHQAVLLMAKCAKDIRNKIIHIQLENTVLNIKYPCV